MTTFCTTIFMVMSQCFSVTIKRSRILCLVLPLGKITGLWHKYTIIEILKNKIDKHLTSTQGYESQWNLRYQYISLPFAYLKKNLTLIRIGVHIAQSYDGKSDIFLIQEASPTLLICHGAFPRTQTRQNGSERRCGRWVSLLPILFTSHSALGFY